MIKRVLSLLYLWGEMDKKFTDSSDIRSGSCRWMNILKWLAFLQLMGFISLWFTAPFLISLMYNSTAPLAFLNTVIRGQELHSLDYYVGLAQLKLLGGWPYFLPIPSYVFLRGVFYTRGPLRYFLISLIFCLLLLFRFEIYVRGLMSYLDISEDRDHHPNLTQSQIVNLGWAHDSKTQCQSSYTQYHEAKRPGVIRVGIFGCSVVEGVESAPSYDFPSVVQKLFAKSGYDFVEVINFGVRGYGMHQSYLLWQYLHRKYELDYVIFFPFPFHMIRDRSFQFADGSTSIPFSLLHDRYVVEKNDLKLLNVIGKERKEAVEKYHRILPPRQYLRYDYRMPPLIRAFLPPFLRDRTNPFYYLSPKENSAEILKSYELIFSKIAQQSKRLIILCADDVIYKMCTRLPSSHLLVHRMKSMEFINGYRNLYHAPESHPSAFGNQLLGEELFSLLTGDKIISLDLLEFRVWDALSRSVDSVLLPLNRYSEVKIQIGGVPVSSFVFPDFAIGNYMRTRKVDFRKQGIISLLCFSIAENASNLKFIPLKFFLEDHSPLFLSFKLNNRRFKIPIGMLNAPSGVMGSIRLSFNSHENLIWKDTNLDVSLMHPNQLENFIIETKSPVTEPSLFLGERKIWEGKVMRGSDNSDSDGPAFQKSRKKVLCFDHSLFDYIYLRAGAGQYLNVHQLKDRTGTVDLVVKNERGEERRQPFLTYELNRVEVDQSKELETYSFHGIEDLKKAA